MKQKNIFKILFILIAVLVAGYLYFNVSIPSMAPEIKNTVTDNSRSLIINSEVYGLCDQNDTCPTFTITDNGEYRYVHTPRGTNTEVLRTGNLPVDIQRQLTQAVTKDALEKMNRSIEPDQCDSYVNGVDARFIVDFDGVVYELDSCGTNVKADSATWEVLGGLWYYLELSQ
jgi:hypothetical protein